MNIWSRQNLSGAGALVIAFMLANVLNFAFNAFLSRALSIEDFGSIVFYNTVLSLVAIFFGALSATLNHRVAYLNGRYHHEAGISFLRAVRAKALMVSLVLMLLWIALAWFISSWFQVQSVASVILFSPIFLFGLVSAANRGYLQGNFFFLSVGLILILEALTKLVFAAGFVFLDLKQFVYLSIPISLLASFVLAMFLVRRKTQVQTADNQFKFPKRFFASAVLNSIATVVFLSLGLVLAKHYLTPTAAGEYALLSLAGSMIYFAGSIPTSFMITFVSHEEGEAADPRRTFRWLLAACFGVTALAVTGIGILGPWLVPFLFGSKAQAIVGYLKPYSFAIGLFTVSSAVISYHLARRNYSFSVAVLLIPIILGLGIMLRHENILQIINVYFLTSILGTALIVLMHLLQYNGRFIFTNLVDLFNIFAPLQQQDPLNNGGKRILVMNWRDTKHFYAGGAEVYVHELAKRWVKEGNQVTLFCGNDGKSLRDETIDGVRVIRRGGFYFVYFWAFIYYLTRFRGQFDLIVDCHNGIPFFTPLYAKEKIYSVLFHVHQEVFFKYLPKPAAWFASILENRLMPYVYRNVKFLTISESTKKDMENLDLTGSGIEILFPGVDLWSMKPGIKDPNPTVLYLGRLKAYKSVDVLIQSFKLVVAHIKNAKLFIAGSGEEQAALKNLTEELGLDSQVQFLGKVSDEEKVQLMQRAWVFVNPSMMEGWGITTIEANACGTPVVAADVPGLRDSVKNPHTGFLVPHGDADVLGKKIIELLENQELRQEMAKEAITWAQQFDWDLSSKKGLVVLNAK